MGKKSFLFTTWEGGGNVTPAIEAARRLVAKGHRVRFMSEECNRHEAEQAGLAFRAWRTAPSRKDRHPSSQLCKDYQEGLVSVIRDLWCGPALEYARDTVEELRQEPADLVVTCEALFGVVAGCESIGQRVALLSPNISLAPIPGIPPVGPGLAPARNEQERALHAEVANGGRELFNAGLPSLNAARAALGLPALENLLDQWKVACRELLATSPAFDFPAETLPERVRYVGPILSDPAWSGDWVSPWEPSDPRPLVLVAFSTTFQDHGGVLQRVMDALESLPARVLVTLGGSIEGETLRSASNCVVVPAAPHTQVLDETALVVTHGGHGTVVRTLAKQVPMLVIPHGRDQNDNAARVEARNAGLRLGVDATLEAIREACKALLEEPKYREGARTLGRWVAQHAANCTVVQELEEAATLATCPN